MIKILIPRSLGHRRTSYGSGVTPEEVGVFAESLPQVKRKGTAAQPAWYVNDRLVVRLVDATTAVIRVPLTEREALLDEFPTGFGVPPRMEAHHKVEAYLDRADPAAVRKAIELAWEMQRR
jgi:hypothetical protein